MVILSKQQKALTISIAILYDDIYKKRKGHNKEKKSEKILGEKLYQERKSSGFFHVLTRN